MIAITGKVTKGLGAASSTLPLQMPFFVKVFPEVKDCHLASINIYLGQTGLRVFNPDFTTPQIPWAGGAGEYFSFLRIALEIPIASNQRRAWIYIPHGSPHFYDPTTLEIITQWIEGVSQDTICQIHISKPHAVGSLVIV